MQPCLVWRLTRFHPFRCRGAGFLSAGFLCLALLGLLPARAAYATTRTVNSSADNQNNGCSTAPGDCTLREAIAASIDNDSINFAAGLNGATIALSGTELGIARNLTIIGPNAGLTIDANHLSRIFNVSAGTVRLSNLTIAGGRVDGVDGANATFSSNAEPGGSASGGGIRNAGTLILTNCRVIGSLAVGGDGGAGYANTTTQSFGFSAGAGFGGGIANEGSLTLINCSVSDNFAFGGLGGVTYDVDGSSSRSGAGGSALGGGIFSESNSTLIMTGCTLSGNYAYGYYGGKGEQDAYGGDGGYAIGGGLQSNATTTTLKNCTVSNNSAVGGNGGVRGKTSANVSPNGIGGSGFGGGINSNSALTLLNCTLSGNTAQGGVAGGASTISGSVGGGGLSGFGCIIRNTIIAGNSIISSRASGPDVKGNMSSQGHNFIGNTGNTGNTGDSSVSSGWVASDLKGDTNSTLDPGLGPLQNNGGPTPTMALLSTSGAIDKGDDAVSNPPFNLTTDQRGYARKIGAHVDIGAFEFDPPQSATALLVTTTDEHDDGTCGAADCTLMEALNATNANANTINFKPGLSGTITTKLSPVGLAISNPVTINGPGARILTISGANLGRV
ncbi:MAG: CSLREA domain-containing protein, partial [Armatimonadota bacterium]|nr:CSLREA domain-containing protein [Armatimonadota bacterium]